MQAGAPQSNDWRKFVTLDPFTHLTFRPTDGDQRASANVKLINKGAAPIMFKIKTTKPNRYLVRPSQGVIGQNNEVEVQVLFTPALDSPVSLSLQHSLLLLFLFGLFTFAGRGRCHRKRQIFGAVDPSACQFLTGRLGRTRLDAAAHCGLGRSDRQKG